MTAEHFLAVCLILRVHGGNEFHPVQGVLTFDKMITPIQAKSEAHDD
ncbi:MAG: hypothetical protein HQL91_00715 [Magnetococcales bacterium]|nr:hypothetical protein [Magnetococcales bacterium]